MLQKQILSLRFASNKLLKCEKLLIFLEIYGATPFTSRQYGILNSIIQTPCSADLHLTTHKATRMSQSNYMLSNIFPTSHIYFVEGIKSVILPPAQQKEIITRDGEYRDVRDCVRHILPNQWPQLNILIYPSYIQLYDTINNFGDRHIYQLNNLISSKQMT